ncbi:MAG: transporter associated domain-containing protein [Gammaproteobacteria bacterium]|nr:transporter associated domain-containing protein [Gammaproteobacteria bacterium]
MKEMLASQSSPKKSWFKKLCASFQSEPKSKEDLLIILRAAAKRRVLNNEALKMIEGVMDVSSMQVRDIMIPRSQMTVIEKSQPLEDFLPNMVNASHSRFPVIDENKEDIIGILLAKDLLRYCSATPQKDFDWTQLMRPAFFVPESKRLDALLNEFRSSHSHLAIVVDEYGGVAGLVTIEDVLEEIVGDIEDEFDEHKVFIQKLNDQTSQVNALISIEEFNEHFQTSFLDDEVDTMGGIIVQAMGHVPKPGESIKIQGLEFKVSKSDGRRILMLEVVRIEPLHEISE